MEGAFKKTERRGLPGGPNEVFTYTTGVFSTQGYKADSPDVDNPFNIIPSGNITMDGVEFPVHGVDNLGNSSIMLPGNDYEFPGDMVLERPIQDLNLKNNSSRKNVLGYGFAFPETREGNFIAGAGVNFLPIGTQFAVTGVLPMQSNPVFKGVGTAGVSQQIGDFNIGIGANKDFLNDYETGQRLDTPIKPSFNVRYTKTFQDGGPLDSLPYSIKDMSLGSDLEYERQYVKDNYGNPNKEVADRVLAYMKLIEEADAQQQTLDAQREEEAYLEKFVPASDNTRVETRVIDPLTPEEKIIAKEYAEARKKEQEDFEKRQWKKYDDASTFDAVLDRTKAFVVDPLGMTARFITGDQAYFPGMGEGLLNSDSPEYENYLRAVGYTPGEIEASDIQNMINPMYWGASIGNNINKGNYGTAALEAGLTALPFIPKGAGRALGSSVTQGSKKLVNNAWKINPLAYQYNVPENVMLRGIGKEGMEDAIQSGVFRPKVNPVSNKVGPFEFTKTFDKTYWTPSMKVAQSYSPTYMAEVPRDVAKFNRRYSGTDWSQWTRREIPIDEGRILQQHWLQGYKPIKAPITNSDDIVRAGFDGNFITKPLTPFTRTDMPKDFKTWYRKIGGKKGLQDLLEKQGAQAPGPIRMKTGTTVDVPFFGRGVKPSESYRGKYAVGVKPEALDKYDWSSWVGGIQNYGSVPVVDGKLIKNLPLEDLNVYKRKWFSNNYKLLDPKNLASEAERSAMQEYLETVWKWGARSALADEFLNDGDLRKEYIEKPIGDLLKKQSGGETEKKTTLKIPSRELYNPIREQVKPYQPTSEEDYQQRSQAYSDSLSLHKMSYDKLMSTGWSDKQIDNAKMRFDDAEYWRSRGRTTPAKRGLLVAQDISDAPYREQYEAFLDENMRRGIKRTETFEEFKEMAEGVPGIKSTFAYYPPHAHGTHSPDLYYTNPVQPILPYKDEAEAKAKAEAEAKKAKEAAELKAKQDTFSSIEGSVIPVVMAEDKDDLRGYKFRTKYGEKFVSIDDVDTLKQYSEMYGLELPIPGFQTGREVKVDDGTGNVTTMNTSSQEYKDIYPNLVYSEDGTPVVYMPEIEIAVNKNTGDALPYYSYLTESQKKWLETHQGENDPITRYIRSQAREGYGIGDNPTFAQSTYEAALTPFREMATIAAEETGIPSAYRISQDPMGTLEGVYNTAADAAYLNSLQGMINLYQGTLGDGEFNSTNPFTGKQYGSGLEQTANVLGVIPAAGTVGVGLRQGLKKAVPAARKAYVNMLANTDQYDDLVWKAGSLSNYMDDVAPSMEKAALRFTNEWRQPQRSLNFDYKKNLDEALDLRAEAQGNRNLLMQEQANEIDDVTRLFEESKDEIIRTSSSFEDAGKKIKLLEDQYDEIVGAMKEKHKKAITEYDDYFKENDAYIRETEENIRRTSADPDFRAKAERIVKEGEYTPETQFEKYLDAHASYDPTFPNTEARTVSIRIDKRKGPESLSKDPKFHKLSESDQEYLLENYHRIGGVNTEDASITFLEDIEVSPLKKIQDNVYENTGNTWNPKKIREAYEKEFQIEDDLINKAPKRKLKDFQETVVHESGHDSQAYINWIKRLTKYDPEFKYSITKGDSDIAKQFKDVLRKPVKEIGDDGKPIRSIETWYSGAGELHSELDRVRFATIKDWINRGKVNTIEEGVRKLKKMEREGSDELYKFYESRLRNHWDKSATYDKKKAVLQMLPALTGFGIGANLVGGSSTEESPLPQQQRGGEPALRDNTYVDIKTPQFYEAPVDNTRVEKKIVPEPMVLSQNIDFEGLKKGIAQAESLGGVLMINPESTATGLYGQRFSEIEDSYKGTREDFAKDTTYQEELFKKRFYEGLKDTKNYCITKRCNRPL